LPILIRNEIKSKKNFFLNNFKPKGKPSPEKDVNLQKVRKFIPKWKIGRKWLMHDKNTGMW
jgi:hypothetical protein